MALRDRSELIVWSSSFACGVKLIDDQHKELVTLVNDMFNHICGNPAEERAYFKSVIDKAVKYVKIHFRTEEVIMSKTNFSGLWDHKKTHDGFILEVLEKSKAFDINGRGALNDFTKFLKEWILTHIAVMDREYFVYLREVATKKQNGKLTITPADIAKRNRTLS